MYHETCLFCWVNHECCTFWTIHSTASKVGQSRVQWSPIIPQLRHVACLNVFFFTSTFTSCLGWYFRSCSRIHPLKFGIRFATSNDLSHNEIDLFLIQSSPCNTENKHNNRSCMVLRIISYVLCIQSIALGFLWVVGPCSTLWVSPISMHMYV